MSLSPIIGAASQILGLFSSSKASSQAAPVSSDAPSIVDSAGKIDLSQSAQLFSKLQDLSQSDPARFKQLTAKISSQLQVEAQKSTGSAQTFLSHLASQFQTASQTGSTAPLHPGSHHNHSASPSVSQAAYQSAGPVNDAAAIAESTVQGLLNKV